MTRFELLWLGGAIWVGLGLAHNHLWLKLLGLAAWGAAAWLQDRNRRTNPEE
ncbi:hypothetical protein BDK92_7293 [Micromonospora pisi]|uniref:Uncharacterized protein n=1 Tax=Micromonospora pisi TaxID=589240 RepID=A0A495JVF2_9ACTN|nr:hypothetical protein [Micromonospora pisi]RKR92811.1 hypothetical protein BDK92_7293 [Micromonospora pisi]